jgi:hypothetical protein
MRWATHDRLLARIEAGYAALDAAFAPRALRLIARLRG